MFPHPIHDVQSNVPPSYARGLGSYCKRVYKSLGMVLSDFGEQIIDIAAHIDVRRLDSSNDLNLA